MKKIFLISLFCFCFFGFSENFVIDVYKIKWRMTQKELQKEFKIGLKKNNPFNLHYEGKHTTDKNKKKYTFLKYIGNVAEQDNEVVEYYFFFNKNKLVEITINLASSEEVAESFIDPIIENFIKKYGDPTDKVEGELFLKFTFANKFDLIEFRADARKKTKLKIEYFDKKFL